MIWSKNNKINTTMKEKGLMADIYRDDYNCPLNVLDKKKKVIIIDDSIPGIFAPSEDYPAVRIVKRNLRGDREYIHAEPMETGPYSFGGSFIYSSDSRFHVLNEYPIPLHDRDMSMEMK